MANVNQDILDTFYNSCFDWYGGSSKLYPEFAKLNLSIDDIKTFCDGYINWLDNENNPKELGIFMGDTTDIERVGVMISMEFGLAKEKINELKDETDSESQKINELAKKMRTYSRKTS